MMSKYPSGVWLTEFDTLNLSTLSRLLDESTSNLPEIELWKLVSKWAERECKDNGLAMTPENKRCLINTSGLFTKIRFFTFTQNEISDVIVPSGLLTEEELNVIRSHSAQATSGQKQCSQTLCGFNSNLIGRYPVSNIGFNKCYRDYHSKRQIYTYGGTVTTDVTCSSRVLFIGFSMFTRIPSIKDYYLGRGNVAEYTEDLFISITDEEGNLINKTKHNRQYSVFNTQQEIMLSKPFWLNPNKKYRIQFKLPDGQYPLYDLSLTASFKSVYFTFKDFIQYSEAMFDNLKPSVIHSLLFNI